MKVLVATDKPFAAAAVNGIRQVIETAGCELLLLEKYTTKQELLDAVAQVDAIIIRSDKVDAEVIAAAKQLKIVVRAGAGYDNVDLDAASAARIVVMNTPGQNANAVAELTFALMLYSIRNAFNGKSGSELLGKTIGIHGYGNIGRNIARIARGFGMNVCTYTVPALTPEQIEAEQIKVYNSAAELYANAQYVSINVPLLPETRGCVNADLLRSMPKGAAIINSARAEVVNDNDLLTVMNERKDLVYLADVKPSNYDALTATYGERIVCTTAKMGAQTSEANINAGIAAARQIVDFLINGNRTFQVNK